MLIIFYEKILFKQHVIIFHKWFGRVKILGFGSVFSFSFINMVISVTEQILKLGSLKCDS